MTIQDLLQNSYTANVCHRENTLDGSGNVLSFDQVCYNPMNGFLLVGLWLGSIALCTILLIRFWRR